MSNIKFQIGTVVNGLNEVLPVYLRELPIDCGPVIQVSNEPGEADLYNTLEAFFDEWALAFTSLEKWIQQPEPASEVMSDHKPLTRFWCPKCKRIDRIEITMQVNARLIEHDEDDIETSTDDAQCQDTEWGGDSPAYCVACGYRGKVDDFDHEDVPAAATDISKAEVK
jgi:hypothetical protein